MSLNHTLFNIQVNLDTLFNLFIPHFSHFRNGRQELLVDELNYITYANFPAPCWCSDNVR